jgi:hypothetical protein
MQPWDAEMQRRTSAFANAILDIVDRLPSTRSAIIIANQIGRSATSVMANHAEIRRRVGKAAAGATRVLRPEAERQLVLRQWTMTIADVYLPDQPEGAAERVRAWATAIRREV